MQAIQVRYLGPTNTHGTRYKAFCQAGSVTLPQDNSRGAEENAAEAAQALAAKLGWTKGTHGGMYGAQLPGGDWVFVFNTSTLYTFAPDEVK